MLNRDTVSGTALLLVSGAYGWHASTLPQGRGEPGPAFLPMVLAVLLALVAVAILVGGLARSRSDAPVLDNGAVARADPTRRYEPWIAMSVTFLYAVAFIPLGYWISTLLYSFVITWLFRRDRPMVLVLVPAISTGMIYLLFRVLLGARLPAGPFF